MAPFPHRYEVTLAGGPAGYGQISAAGVPDLRTAPPTDFDGPGDAWSPEHLLLASVQACFLFTLQAIARASRLEFLSLEVVTRGVVDRQDRVTRFTEITVSPKITVPRQIDHLRVQQLLEKSERACLISASLSTPIRVVPEIVYEDAAPRAAEGVTV